MPVFLDGLSARFFRGIGPEEQILGPFREFNFFVGSNNSGKSTVLDLIHRYLYQNKSSIQKLDAYTGGRTGPFEFAVGTTREAFVRRATTAFEKLANSRGHSHLALRFNEPISSICNRLVQNQLIWLRTRSATSEFGLTIDEPTIQLARNAISEGMWHDIWSVIANARGGGLTQQWVPEVLHFLSASQKLNLPSVRFIPTNRQIGLTAEKFDDFSGRGLIDRLAELQSPDHDKREELELFSRINSFLQTVTARADAKIEIPHNRQHVLVHMDNKVLPLSNLGTGIHEVVMIAAFCTISEKQIVCIEEPESHLHPLLQRKLISYLQTNTTNQYFVATHSPSFIDTPDAAIFHVTNDGVQTRIKESVLRSERFAICQDLGIRASDIVQSNFVIWVEGPSDRLYVREWIKAVDDSLLEGIHYSIMFYGGRLLSHLSADDDAVTEFIKLRSLNQNLCVLMDSDKSSARSKINPTKQRILDEFDADGSKAWLTKGREIENYIPFDALQNAVKKIYAAKYHSAGNGDPYSHALHYWPKATDGRRGKKLEVGIDKVRVAKAICEVAPNLEVLDLKKNVRDLVNRIRAAN